MSLYVFSVESTSAVQYILSVTGVESEVEMRNSLQGPEIPSHSCYSTGLGVIDLKLIVEIVLLLLLPQL